MNRPPNQPVARDPQPAAADGPLRLAKFLAGAGVASRRAAEELILAGRIQVNGAVATTPACKVDPATDQVLCDGRPVRLARVTHVLMLHKPPGYTCSAADPHAEKLALDLIPKEAGRLFSIGRLDRDSEGLLLFTNDGELAHRLTHPRHEVEKVYLVEVRGRVTPAACQAFLDGVEHEGEWLRASALRVVGRQGGLTQLEVSLREGRKREIRRICSTQHLAVIRLCRFQFGPLELGDLPVGHWRVLTDRELAALRAAHTAAG